MPDDPPRPLSGQQSDPRPIAGAPAWWGALGRADLPLDPGDAPPPARLAPPAHTPSAAPGETRLARLRWRTWAFNIAVLAVAVLVICVGVGVVSISMFLTVALLFGIPLLVAAGTATVMARRSG